MELKIISPAENEFLQVINFNNEEIKQELAESLKKYEGLVYTEDNIKSAKLDRATLNKFKEAMEKKRIEIKKQCLKPYDDFETKVKEITGMVEKPISAIDKQVKAFEESQKKIKREKITAFYGENIGDLVEVLPLAKIWDERWLNVASTSKAINTGITETIAKVKNDLEVIAGLKSEFELQIKDTYLKGLDLSAALAEKTRLEEQKIKTEEYNRIRVEKIRAQEVAKKAAEEERKAQQAEVRHEIPSDTFAQKAEVVEPKPEYTPMPEQVKRQFIEPEVAEPAVIKMDFRVWVTNEQLAGLKSFLLANGIKYGRVE